MSAPLDPIRVDVGRLVQTTVASLYAHLVTRQTGRAVRLAIETRLEGAGERAVSIIDLSEVTILDFSCADEVVAKLLQRYANDEDTVACFVFCGVNEPHRDPIEVVLERQGLAAVVRTDKGRFELLGRRSPDEERVWSGLEERGRDTPPDPESAEALAELAARRLVYWNPVAHTYHALSTLVEPMIVGSAPHDDDEFRP